MKARLAVLFALVLAFSTTALADFRYEEKSTITGGSAMNMMKMAGAYNKQARQPGQPTISTVYLKGNRLARVSSDSSEIIDLDKETITHVDHARRQYSVTTFAQMKQMLQQAGGREADVSYEVNVRNTGATKQIAGLTTKQAILTMNVKAQQRQAGPFGSMSMTNDMWLAPNIPGYAEVRDFHKRYAAKIGSMFTGMNAMPGMGKGMAELAKEMSKLDGVPVYQVMRMGGGGPAMPDMSGASDDDDDAQAAAMKKKMAAMMGGGAGGVLMETTVEMSNFATGGVDASKFDVPAGYTKVEADKRGR